MHWADQAAQQIVERHAGPYTVASGITPSGTVHLGNFREVFTTHLVARVLRELGHEVIHYHFWDDYDVFRKVPANVDQRMECYLGLPLYEIDGGYFSARNIFRFETELERLGIEPAYIYQSREYQLGTYQELVEQAVVAQDSIREILNRHRRVPLEEDWRPCTDRPQKLVWRVDWPMRWAYYSIDFEPGGRDHTAPSGSYETGSEIAREVFGVEPPEYLGYNFVQTDDGRMSSSSGNVLTLTDVLKDYNPRALLWHFARQRADRDFAVSLDSAGVINQQFEQEAERYREGNLNEIRARSYELIS